MKKIKDKVHPVYIMFLSQIVLGQICENKLRDKEGKERCDFIFRVTYI